MSVVVREYSVHSSGKDPPATLSRPAHTELRLPFPDDLMRWVFHVRLKELSFRSFFSGMIQCQQSIEPHNAYVEHDNRAL